MLELHFSGNILASGTCANRRADLFCHPFLSFQESPLRLKVANSLLLFWLVSEESLVDVSQRGAIRLRIIDNEDGKGLAVVRTEKVSGSRGEGAASVEWMPLTLQDFRKLRSSLDLLGLYSAKNELVENFNYTLRPMGVIALRLFFSTNIRNKVLNKET